MRQLLWALLLMGAVACQDDGQKDGQADGEPGSAVVAEEPQGGFVDPLPQAKTPMASLLCTNYWVFEFYVVDDRAARAANKGRWFKFNMDGTYESGHWQEQTGYGSWSLRNEEGKFVLYLDNIYDSQDGSWEIQGVNQDQDTMTWSGVNKTNTSGVITKTISLLTRPTKAQFGVEE